MDIIKSPKTGRLLVKDGERIYSIYGKSGKFGYAILRDYHKDWITVGNVASIEEWENIVGDGYFRVMMYQANFSDVDKCFCCSVFSGCVPEDGYREIAANAHISDMWLCGIFSSEEDAQAERDRILARLKESCILPIDVL